MSATVQFRSTIPYCGETSRDGAPKFASRSELRIIHATFLTSQLAWNLPEFTPAVSGLFATPTKNGPPAAGRLLSVGESWYSREPDACSCPDLKLGALVQIFSHIKVVLKRRQRRRGPVFQICIFAALSVTLE